MVLQVLVNPRVFVPEPRQVNCDNNSTSIALSMLRQAAFAAARLAALQTRSRSQCVFTGAFQPVVQQRLAQCTAALATDSYFGAFPGLRRFATVRRCLLRIICCLCPETVHDDVTKLHAHAALSCSSFNKRCQADDVMICSLRRTWAGWTDTWVPTLFSGHAACGHCGDTSVGCSAAALYAVYNSSQLIQCTY